MSTTAPEQTTTDVTTFRGRSLEELLPQIRDALGPDAIVLKQRDGLMGGIGGFFQQRFVEVDARAGHARVDTYDEEPEPFAQLLAAAETEAAELDGGPRITVAPTDPDSLSSHEPTPFEARPATLAPSLTSELTAKGMSHAFASKLIADAEAHELPFAPDARTATRRALARKLPTALPHRAGALAVAFAGPGSTGCADALATAYKRAGRDARAVASLDKARALVERADADQVLAVDLPPIATDRAEVDALAARIHQLQLDDVIAVVPADLDLPTARALMDRLQPLSPTALALSLDADDAHIGAAVELACTTRLPIAYVQSGTSIAPADPATLAERLLR
ncbi:MAG: hypothetical protein ACTHOE_01655 [Conexibacter sp.]